MMKVYRTIAILLTIWLVLAGCAQDEPTPPPVEETPLSNVSAVEEVTAEPTEAPQPTEEPQIEEMASEAVEPTEDPIYLSIIWHQHQPVYFKEAETNSYIRP